MDHMDTDREEELRLEDQRDHLPGVSGARAWLKIAWVMAILALINAAAFLTSYGFGIVITLPVTLFMGFLLVRDILPRHRFPPGRRSHTSVLP